MWDRRWAKFSTAAEQCTQSTIFKLVLYALVFFAILFARRSDQLIHPQVWDEDGSQILRDLINNGPVSLLWPLNGYLVVIARVISLLSLSISVTQYPLISTILAWAFTIATLLAISVSPLVLRGGILIALVAALIPSDPEVFGLPLYTFWWAGLLIVLAALWRPGAGHTAWRVAFVVVGGLSSPVLLLVLPLFIYRIFAWRNDVEERIVTIVATVCTVVQVLALVLSHNVAQKSVLSVSTALAALPLFLGNYVLGSFARTHLTIAAALEWTAVIVPVVLFAVAVRNAKSPNRATLIALLYLLFGSIALSAARVPISILNPVLAGPRYFFYPFVFEAWLLLQIVFLARTPAVRSLAAFILLLATLNAVPVLSRSHDDLHWLANVASCKQIGDNETYDIPIESNGHATAAWSLKLTGAQCRSLGAHDILAWMGPTVPPPIAPYRVYESAAAIASPPSIAGADTVISNGWKGTDFQRSRLPGLIVIGSYRTADADTGRLTLRLQRGSRVLFRSGPTVEHQSLHIGDQPPGKFDTALPVSLDWSVLAFTNPRLPPEFTATFEDSGTGWGEWSAVALSTSRR